jgi:hypothetical protein
MKPEDYFIEINNINNSVEINSNHTNSNEKETSRELKCNTVNNNDIQHGDNEKAVATTDEALQVNNFIAKQNEKVKILNANINKIKKVISMQDYESLISKDKLFYDKRSSLTIFTDFLCKNHPLLKLFFKKSFKDPAFLRQVSFVFSLSLMFAMNAFLFTDKYIDNRMNGTAENRVNIRIINSLISFIHYQMNSIE